MLNARINGGLLRGVLAIALMVGSLPGVARADEEEGPCTGFLVPPQTNVYAGPSESSKPVERREGWLVALANGGTSGTFTGRVRIDVSDRADLMGTCYGRDFTFEKEFLRIWLEPQRFERVKGWVRVTELRTFEFARPEKWTGQDSGVNITRILRASEQALAREAPGKLQTGALPTSEVLGAPPDVVWFAALEGLLKAGWKIDRLDRAGGLITARDRRLDVAEATTCTYMKGETESFGLSVLVAPATSGSRVSAILSFDDDNLTKQKCETRGATEQKVLSAIRAAMPAGAPQ